MGIMSFLGIEKRAASKREIADVKAMTSYAGNWGAFAPYYTKMDKPTNLSTVYRCVYILSATIAQLKMGVYKIDEDGYPSRDTTHPADRLLFQDPNEDMSAYNFKRALITSMLLRGAGFGYISRGTWGEATSITYLPVENVQVVWVTDDNGIRHRRYSVTSFSELVNPKDMIHVLNYTENGLDGQSTISHAASTIGLSANSEKQASNYLTSGGATSGYLSSSTPIRDEQKEQIKKAWKASFSGDDDADIPVLEGNLDHHTISISPKDAQLLESRQFQTLEICRFFGVPPSKVFHPVTTSYKSQEAEQIAFLNDALSPIIANIEEEINRKIFPNTEYGVYKCEFDLNDLVRADKTTQAAYYNTLFQMGVVTPNEIRKSIGKDRIKDGDKSFVQVNVQTLEQAVTKEETNTD